MATELEIQQQLIEELRKKRTSLGGYADLPTGFEVGEEVRRGLTPPKQLIEQIAKARAGLLAAPAEVRARQRPGWVTPQQVSGLIEAEKKPLRTEWETLLGLKAERAGRVEDVLGRVTKMIDADIQKKKLQYDKVVDELRDAVEQQRFLQQMAFKEKELGLKYAPEEEITPTIPSYGGLKEEAKITFQGYKNEGWPQEELEAQWRADNGISKGAELPTYIKEALDEVYAAGKEGWWGQQFRQIGEFLGGTRGPFEFRK